MKAVNNIVRASKSILNATTGTVNVCAEMVADGAELVNKSIPQAPRCVGQVLALPFSASKGYLIHNGATELEADTKAYHFLRQDLSVTIEEVGVGSGKLLAQLLEEEDDDDVVVTTKKPHVNEAGVVTS